MIYKTIQYIHEHLSKNIPLTTLIDLSKIHEHFLVLIHSGNFRTIVALVT